MRDFEFELGVVYERRRRYYLAVDAHTLIGRHKGEWLEVRPYAKYRAVRDMPVGDLCKRWEISSAELDETLRAHFSPAESAEEVELRTRPRGWGETNWRIFRTHRHSLGRAAG